MNELYDDHGYDIFRFERLTHDWLHYLKDLKDNNNFYYICGERGLLKVIGIADQVAILPVYILYHNLRLDSQISQQAYTETIIELHTSENKTVRHFLRLWWYHIAQIYYTRLYGVGSYIQFYVVKEPHICDLDLALETPSSSPE